MAVILPLSLFAGFGFLQFLFQKLKMKLKWYEFDNTEDIQIDLQVVLYNIIRMDCLGVFQHWRGCWDECLHAELLQGDGDQ